jgi:hypothetical protein
MMWARLAIAVANAVAAIASLFSSRKSEPKKKATPYGFETEKLSQKAEEILRKKGGVVRVLTVAPNEEPTIPRGGIPDSPYEDKP